MRDLKSTNQKAQVFFEELWKRGDPWELETSEFEQTKYARQRAMLDGCHYSRALEIGCGGGRFSRLLVRMTDRLVAVDISPTAIARARAVPGLGVVDFRVANIMEGDLRREFQWDLVVFSETIYYLGGSSSFLAVASLAADLFAATNGGGRLLMSNTYGGKAYFQSPWIIRTYRDLFLNVGYQLETEEVFRGSNKGVDREVLVSLFAKARDETGLRAV